MLSGCFRRLAIDGETLQMARLTPIIPDIASQDRGNLGWSCSSSDLTVSLSI